MKVYEVRIPEIHESVMHVEANDGLDAIERVLGGEGWEIECFYTHNEIDGNSLNATLVENDG